MFIKKIFSKIIVCLTCVLVLMPGVMAADNVPGPTGEIGDYGAWTTDYNLRLFTSKIYNDLETFQDNFQNQIVKDYVPVEAKIGIAFMNAMAHIGNILDTSLVRFVIIFIIVAFVFWTGFEAYQLITGAQEVKKTIEGIIKKGFLITVWILILNYGPAKLFMLIAGPIISIGTYMSDLILNAVTTAVDNTLPDTCAAIHEYAAANMSPNATIDANAAANIMCVPTRLSGFFYTAVAAGGKWMLAGISHSAFKILMGGVFVVIFLMNIWKFALIAFGVIADLFMTIFMLPFTAISETIGKTSYQGIAGTIFNGFLDLFKTESLETQINRFINAAIYFVSLSIIVAICMAILSGVMHANLISMSLSITNDNFMITLLVGCLVWYLADKALSMAKELGGSIDDSMGKEFGNTVTRLISGAKNTTQKYYKIYKDSKK